MVKKALDPRIPTIIKNNVQNRQRSMFVIVGDKGKDQVCDLQHNTPFTIIDTFQQLFIFFEPS